MIIYKITNLINGKIYIGKTYRDVNVRWMEHCKKTSHCSLLTRAIQKYKKENFKIEVIFETKNAYLLNRKEVYFIKLYNTINPEKGYNLRTGGEGGKHTSEYKKRMSEKQKGRTNSYLYKSVYKIDPITLEVIKIYPSLSSVTEDGYDTRQVRAVCNNERRNFTYKKYCWVYELDYPNFKPPEYNRIRNVKGQYEAKYK